MTRLFNRRQFSALIAGAARHRPAPRLALARQDDATPAACGRGQVYSTGPNGESPTAASE